MQEIPTDTTVLTGLQAPPQLQERMTAEQQLAFASYFIAARDKVEDAYYAELDRRVPPRQRMVKFAWAMIKPLLGRPINDPEQFYETYGRLMRRAWLSISVGVYNDAIHAIPDPARRLLAGQVNTVDIAWEAAVSRLLHNGQDGLLVDVGTGRGNSIVRLCYLLPRVRVISITISPEQAEIADQIVRELGLENRVEVRLGDVFDPAITRDLAGKADGVTAIEVAGHFPHERKAEGIAIMARMLRPSAPLSLIDTAVARPVSRIMRSYMENQGWYVGTPEGYLSAFEDSGVTLAQWVTHTRQMVPSLVDSTRVLRSLRGRLREEFGPIVAALWPETPQRGYMPAFKMIDYVHILGVKR